MAKLFYTGRMYYVTVSMGAPKDPFARTDRLVFALSAKQVSREPMERIVLSMEATKWLYHFDAEFCWKLMWLNTVCSFSSCEITQQRNEDEYERYCLDVDPIMIV